MHSRRPAIPRPNVRQLLLRHGYHCPFCLNELNDRDLSNVGRVEIAHRDPFRKSRSHAVKNLAFACPMHHNDWDVLVRNPALFDFTLDKLHARRRRVDLAEIREFLARCWAEHRHAPPTLLRILWRYLGEHRVSSERALLHVLHTEAEALRRSGELRQAVDLLRFAQFLHCAEKPLDLRIDLLMTEARARTGMGSPQKGVHLIRRAFDLAESKSERHPGLLIIYANSLLQDGSSQVQIHQALTAVPWRTANLRRRKPSLYGVLEFLHAEQLGLAGQFSAATRSFAEAKKVLADAGEVRSEAMCLANVARMQFTANRFDASAETMKQAERCYAEVHDRWGLATALIGRADAMLAGALTRGNSASSAVEDSRSLYELVLSDHLVGDQHLVPRVIDNAAIASRLSGDLASARKLRHQAKRIRVARPSEIEDDCTYVQRFACR